MQELAWTLIDERLHYVEALKECHRDLMCCVFLNKNFDYRHWPYQFDARIENSATCIGKSCCVIGQLISVKVPESLNTGQHMYELAWQFKLWNHFFYKDTVVKNETQRSITIFS